LPKSNGANSLVSHSTEPMGSDFGQMPEAQGGGRKGALTDGKGGACTKGQRVVGEKKKDNLK